MTVGIIWDKTNMITMRITMAVEISISKYYKMRLCEISYFQYYTMAKGILIFPNKNVANCTTMMNANLTGYVQSMDIYTTLNF